MNYSVRDATCAMFKRYLDFDIDDADINNLLLAGIENINSLPIDKLSRWLGYVQGYLISNNLTTVDAERDFSRPLFHKAYKFEGIDIPVSIDVKKD